MKIVADENIPFAREAFGTLGEVALVHGRSMTADDVRDAELLFVRSVTKVDAALLDGSRLRFVGSATAGIDHVDLATIARRGIGFASAPGSNANSVGEYMAAAWLTIAVRNGVHLDGLRVGIVGAGHTGSRAAEKARALGMTPVLNDPPLARGTGDPKYRPLDEVFDCDIITCHTPLTYEGPDPTYHLVDKAFLKSVKAGAWLCNAGRGEVADSEALRAAIGAGGLGAVILDVWEREPAIDADVLTQAHIATPHIAGYSYDGKVNGTAMVYGAACKFLGVKRKWNARKAMPPPDVPALAVDAAGRSDDEVLLEAVKACYDVERDDRALRETAGMAPDERGRAFDRLRKEYPRRREFHNTRLTLTGASAELKAKARGLGFDVE